MLVSSQLLALANLALGNNNQYPLIKGWVGPRTTVDVSGDNKNLLSLLKTTLPQLQNKVTEIHYRTVNH
jgi:hypothetical protein